jgi:hypothetical protein
VWLTGELVGIVTIGDDHAGFLVPAFVVAARSVLAHLRLLREVDIQERSRRIGTVAAEQLGVENQLRVKVYCSVQPRPFAVDFDSGLVNCDPRGLRPRRVWSTVSQPMYPVPNRSMRAFNA